jgi:phospholipid transport system substrate-binding protein
MMFSKTLPKLAALLVLSTFTLPVQAADSAAATTAPASNQQVALDFVKDTAEKGLTFLSKPNSTEEEKKAEFKTLLNNSFDMDSIGRFTLGRYWNVATPAQQTEYQAVQKDGCERLYSTFWRL